MIGGTEKMVGNYWSVVVIGSTVAVSMRWNAESDNIILEILYKHFIIKCDVYLEL